MSKSLGLNLLVIRTSDLQRDADFYSVLGFEFEKHRHGNGPEHFAAQFEGFVFEIYPIHKSKPPTTGVRFGFSVPSVDEAVERLVAVGAKVVTTPSDSPWGRRAVIEDLEGHRVEISLGE